MKFDIEDAQLKAVEVADLSEVGPLVGELHPDDPSQMRELIGLLGRGLAVHTQPIASRWLLRAPHRGE